MAAIDSIETRTDTSVQGRLEEVLDRAVAERRIVGGVALVARDGRLVARHAVGLADREAGVALRPDAVFRLASLTKPMVTVAALGLVDRGALGLEDPVTRWLTDFRPAWSGAPGRITVQHLLTHTSGLSYTFLEPPGGPYHRANVSDGLDQPGLSLEENLRRLGSLPLAFAPGSAFLYSLSSDVLGGVLERAAGRPLPDIVRSAVTVPLGLSDTSFAVRDASRLVTPYADGVPAPTRMVDGAYVPLPAGGATFAPSRALDPRSYPSGGAGMVGTAGDFLVFLEAVRARRPLLPARWLAEMTRDQIAPLTSLMLGDGWGYGYGMSVLRDPRAAASPLHAGSVRWGGAYGHTWWIDPVARVSGVLLTNTAFEGMIGRLRDEVTRAVHGEPPAAAAA